MGFAAVGLIGGVVGLIACSSMGHEEVFNATQQELIIRLEPTSIFGRRFLPVEHGGHGRFSPADKPDGYVVLSTRTCIYYYDPPPVERSYWPNAPYGGADVFMQIEPDMRIYLLPSGPKTIMGRRELMKIQRYGFPQPAVGKVCRRHLDG
jgi:hypothetical protein